KPILGGNVRWKNSSVPAGAKATYPAIAAWRPASNRLPATSRRNAVLSAAACSKVNGGTSRVLGRPGAGALAMTAVAHDPVVRDRLFSPVTLGATGLDFPRSRFARFM